VVLLLYLAPFLLYFSMKSQLISPKFFRFRTSTIRESNLLSFQHFRDPLGSADSKAASTPLFLQYKGRASNSFRVCIYKKEGRYLLLSLCALSIARLTDD